jgi:hypothetical protein
MKIPAVSQYTINLGLFYQNGGYVFVAVPLGSDFYGSVLFSGKRKTLVGAITAAKALAGGDVAVVYSRLEGEL